MAFCDREALPLRAGPLVVVQSYLTPVLYVLIVRNTSSCTPAVVAAPLPRLSTGCGCAGIIGPNRMIGKALSPFAPPTILLAVTLFSSLLFCTSFPPFLSSSRTYFDCFFFPTTSSTSISSSLSLFSTEIRRLSSRPISFPYFLLSRCFLLC